jgi:hypothetical protein
MSLMLKLHFLFGVLLRFPIVGDDGTAIGESTDKSGRCFVQLKNTKKIFSHFV